VSGVLIWSGWRCGGSAVAAALHGLGVHLGNSIVGHRKREPWCHYEDMAYSRILSANVGQRMDPHSPDSALDELAALYRKYGKHHNAWALKDPRAVFSPHAATRTPGVKVISVWRGIPKTAESIEFTVRGKGKKLAVLYKQTHQKARDKFTGDVLDVNYDALMVRTEEEVGRIAQFVGLPVTRAAVEAVRWDLYHHRDTPPIRTHDVTVKDLAQRIEARQPFSLVRYGEGEFRIIVEELGTKLPAFPFWFDDDGRRTLRDAFEHSPVADNFYTLIWHQQFLQDSGWLEFMEKWIANHTPHSLKFYDGWLWRKALTAGRLYPFIEAVRDSGLPVVIVGAQWLKQLNDATGWDIRKHVVTHKTRAFFQKDEMIEAVLDFPSPAIVCFSCGSISNVAITELYQKVGNEKFLINCGAMWDPLCGNASRIFHHRLSDKVKRWNLKGRPDEMA
jgi:hypothetical protein